MVAIEERYLTVREAALYLGLEPLTLVRMARSGRVKSFKLGNRYKFRKSDLDAALQEVDCGN